MFRKIKTIIILIIIILIAAASYKFYKGKGKVVAKVGDTEITTTDIEFYKKFNIQGKTLSDEQIINLLVEKEILFNEAKKSGLGQKAEALGKEQVDNAKKGATDKAMDFAKSTVDGFLKDSGMSESKYWQYAQDFFTKEKAAELVKKPEDMNKLKQEYNVKIY